MSSSNSRYGWILETLRGLLPTVAPSYLGGFDALNKDTKKCYWTVPVDSNPLLTESTPSSSRALFPGKKEKWKEETGQKNSALGPHR